MISFLRKPSSLPSASDGYILHAVWSLRRQIETIIFAAVLADGYTTGGLPSLAGGDTLDVLAVFTEPDGCQIVMVKRPL
jgi:hypothetical protein